MNKKGLEELILYTAGVIGTIIGWGATLGIVVLVRIMCGMPPLTESVALWTCITCLASANIVNTRKLRQRGE